MSVQRLAKLGAMTLLLASVWGCRPLEPEQSTLAGNPSVQMASRHTPVTSGAVDISKKAKLGMVLIGDKPKDFKTVFDELNRLAQADLNAELEVRYLSWGDWQQRYPLLFATGDEFDLIFTANWAQYNTQATKGGFLELTPSMLERYAPLTAASAYPEALQQARMGGKLFMLPMNFKEVQGSVSLIREDLLREQGLTVQDITQHPRGLERWYSRIVDSGSGLVPVNAAGLNWWGMPLYIPLDKMNDWFDLVGTGNLRIYYVNAGGRPRVFSFYDTEKFMEGVKVTKEWADKGFWPKSALVSKTTDNEAFLNGKAVIAGGNLATSSSFYHVVQTAHPDWRIAAVDTSYGNTVDIKPFIQNGMAINRNSRNPERALMLLDLLRNDQRYFDLTFYGIEGLHYERVQDGRSIRLLPRSANFSPESAGSWGWRDDRLVRPIEGGLPNYAELQADMLKRAVAAPLQAFNFDDSRVKNELAAVSNVILQYIKPLCFGMVEGNVEEKVKEARRLLKEAGSDRIVEEYQRQTDEYVAQR